MGSVWVLFLLSAHSKATHLAYFAGSPYHVYNYTYLMLTNCIGSSCNSDCFLAKLLPI